MRRLSEISGFRPACPDHKVSVYYIKILFVCKGLFPLCGKSVGSAADILAAVLYFYPAYAIIRQKLRAYLPVNTNNLRPALIYLSIGAAVFVPEKSICCTVP